MALTGLAIAAALALAKDELIDQPAANRKRKLEAATAAYSPWTGLKPQEVNDPNVIGDMMIAGAGGAAMGASIDKANSERDLNNALSDRLNKGTAGSANAAAGDWSAENGYGYDAKSGKNLLGGADMAKDLKAKNAMDMNLPTAVDSDAGGNTLGWYPDPGQSGPGFFGKGPRSIYSDAVKQNPWATLQDAGLSTTNPEDYWQINPFKPKSYGGY